MLQVSSESRVLDPIERTSEVLFGLIMVLTFTGSISAATSGREEVRTILFAALGCNLAWGLVDAVMYVLSAMIERGRKLTFLRRLRESSTAEDARTIIYDELPERLAAVMTPADLDTVAASLNRIDDLPPRVSLASADIRGALGVFLLVFLSTFPVVIPFILFNDLVQAMRWSNGIALLLMFLSGHSLGKYAGFPALLTGGTMVAIGAALVFMIIALGG